MHLDQSVAPAPVGECPLPVGELAAWTVAVEVRAVADLRAARAGLPPGALEAAVPDPRHVALSFRSERLLRVDGRPAGAGFAPLSGFFPAADGWVRLHANAPHHAAALRRALGVDPVSALSRRGRLAAEDDVVGAGGVAAAVRTSREWAEHPAGDALRGVAPLVTTEGTGAPAWVRSPVVAGAPLLAGLRVLDLTRVLAGPVATRTLAAHGADVLRVDPPHVPEDPALASDTGVGKRSTVLDLRVSGDREVVEELLAGADVLVHGYRPGALDRHGLGDVDLAARHPHLLVASLSAWGTTGAWGGRRGFDSIVQAATGIAATTARGGTPGALPVQALDHGCGHLLAAGVLGALADAVRGGGGAPRVRVALAALAGCLLAAPRTGSGAGDAEVPEHHLLDLGSDRGALRVVAPPGAPAWSDGPRRVRGALAGWRGRPAGRVAT